MTILKKLRQQTEEFLILSSVILLVSGGIIGIANLIDLLK